MSQVEFSKEAREGLRCGLVDRVGRLHSQYANRRKKPRQPRPSRVGAGQIEARAAQFVYLSLYSSLARRASVCALDELQRAHSNTSLAP